jgi:hypothetical protein
VFSLASSISRPYSLTTTLTSPLTNTALTITNVYAPSNHQDSPAFLAELADLLPSISGPWLLVGDFNLLRGAADKNQGHLDNHLCSLFNNTLDCLGVVELQLQDCLFTWSNMRSAPTLARLDRAFVNNDHTSSFPSTTLTTLPRLASDHKPLLVSMSTSIPKSRIFRFENAWLHHPLFLPEVLPAWHQETPCPDAAGRLAGKLKRVRAAAKRWARQHKIPPSLIPNCRFLILLLDCLEEHRCLSPPELQVRTVCRERLVLAIKTKATFWKQRSKHRAIVEGDANTAFHHAIATHRMRQNQITTISVGGCDLSSHASKSAAVTDYFRDLMSCKHRVRWDFSLNTLYSDCPRASSVLDAPFLQSEAKNAVRMMNKTARRGPMVLVPASTSPPGTRSAPKFYSCLQNSTLGIFS